MIKRAIISGYIDTPKVRPFSMKRVVFQKRVKGLFKKNAKPRLELLPNFWRTPPVALVKTFMKNNPHNASKCRTASSYVRGRERLPLCPAPLRTCLKSA